MEPKIQSPQAVNEIQNTLENQRAHAMDIAVLSIERLLRDIPCTNVIKLFGGEFPVRPDSVVDTIVLDAQALSFAAKSALQEAIQKGDPKQEMAAAKVAAMLESNEEGITKFAEFLEHFPSTAARLGSLSPTLAALMRENNSTKIKTVDSALNDEKYNVAA